MICQRAPEHSDQSRRKNREHGRRVGDCAAMSVFCLDENPSAGLNVCHGLLARVEEERDLIACGDRAYAWFRYGHGSYLAVAQLGSRASRTGA